MSESEIITYPAVTFTEAAARHLRVDLVCKPVPPGSERRLISHLLGMRTEDELVLAVPTTPRGEKVHVPAGWLLGMAFDLEGTWVQAKTVVLGHCLYATHRPRRVDGLVVRKPSEVHTRRRLRRHVRYTEPTGMHTAMVWPASSVQTGAFAPMRVAKVDNWSQVGLGLLLPEPVDEPLQTVFAIRLQRLGGADDLMFWGRLKHCTRTARGLWTAGFGDLASIPPGQAVNLMRFLAAPND